MFNAGIVLGAGHAGLTPGITCLIVAGELEDSSRSKVSPVNACDVVLAYQREEENNVSDTLARIRGMSRRYCVTIMLNRHRVSGNQTGTVCQRPVMRVGLIEGLELADHQSPAPALR